MAFDGQYGRFPRTECRNESKTINRRSWNGQSILLMKALLVDDIAEGFRNFIKQWDAFFKDGILKAKKSPGR